MRKPLPNALDIDLAGGLTEEVTPHEGVALLIELGRRSGVMAAADKHLPPKKSAKGLGQDQMAESFVLLSALGGDCIDDFEGLRLGYGLQALTFNLLELLKAAALDVQCRNARPKRLRFAIFTQFGRVVHHARGQLVRLVNLVWETLVISGRRRLRASVWPAC